MSHSHHQAPPVLKPVPCLSPVEKARMGIVESRQALGSKPPRAIAEARQ